MFRIILKLLCIFFTVLLNIFLGLLGFRDTQMGDPVQRT